jgi:hypothetical protein
MDTGTERRNGERRGCLCEADWSYFNRDDYVQALVLNFSQDGIFLETLHPISRGATILIRIRPGQEVMSEKPQGPRLNALAEVKWCRKRNGDGEPGYCVGVRYHFPT